jgi:hypothetical protein
MKPEHVRHNLGTGTWGEPLGETVLMTQCQLIEYRLFMVPPGMGSGEGDGNPR